MTHPETDVNQTSTEKLISEFKNLLNLYGHIPEDPTAEPGLVSRAGFLDHNVDSRFLMSSVYVISEWVDVNQPGCPSVYQYDNRSHLTSPHMTEIIDENTDEQRAIELLTHRVPSLTAERAAAYENPDYAWVLKSLFDPEGYEADRQRAMHASKRQKRAERKQITNGLIEEGEDPSFARHIARTIISNRYN